MSFEYDKASGPDEAKLKLNLTEWKILLGAVGDYIFTNREYLSPSEEFLAATFRTCIVDQYLAEFYGTESGHTIRYTVNHDRPSPILTSLHTAVLEYAETQCQREAPREAARAGRLAVRIESALSPINQLPGSEATPSEPHGL